jgi:cytochrome c oxidase subunit 2
MKGMFVWAVATLAAALGPMEVVAQPAADATRTIEITAEQFRFVPSQIEVLEGETVRLKIRSVDVTHGIAIPGLGIQQGLRPGQEVAVVFVADAPGRYPFACSTFCGAGHTAMTGAVTVLSASGADQTSATDSSAVSAEVNTVEPDFSLISLPTTLALPTNRFGFRLTHRFSRPVDGGAAYGNLLEDFFGFDSPALIGLELRYGLAPGLQIGIHRNNSRNLQLFGRYRVLSAAAHGGAAVDALVSVEGLDNFRDHYSTSLGAVVSRRFADRLAVYVEPMWITNTNKPGLLHRQTDPIVTTDENTFVFGVGARLKVLDTVAVTGEFLPRLAGFDQGENYVAIAVEKVAGGHLFQLNFSNSIGVTPAQLAQGASDDWFIGFNISRRFY